MDKRKRRRLVGRALTIAVLGTAVVLIGIGFLPEPVAVSAGKVERRTLEVTVDETGKTRIRDKYVVSAPATGNMSRIALQVGDEVQAGAVVARIAPLVPQLLDARTRAEASARVAVAESNLKRTEAAIARADTAYQFAKSQAERSRTLRREGGMSEQQFEEAEYRLRASEEELASARLAERVSANELAAARSVLTSIEGQRRGELTELDVIAPAAGRILRLIQESEGAVSAGAPILEIGDPRRLEVLVDVLTTEAVDIKVGAVAHIERWGGDYPLAARVQRKQPSAYTTRSALGVEEQRVPIVLDLVEDPARWSSLGDGYRVEARIRVARIERSLTVAASALFREAEGWAVFAIREGKARETRVEIGARTPDWAEVKRGLTEGDRVVLYPSDQVADGVAVAAR